MLHQHRVLLPGSFRLLYNHSFKTTQAASLVSRNTLNSAYLQPTPAPFTSPPIHLRPHSSIRVDVLWSAAPGHSYRAALTGTGLSTKSVVPMVTAGDRRWVAGGRTATHAVGRRPIPGHHRCQVCGRPAGGAPSVWQLRMHFRRTVPHVLRGTPDVGDSASSARVALIESPQTDGVATERTSRRRAGPVWDAPLCQASRIGTYPNLLTPGSYQARVSQRKAAVSRLPGCGGRGGTRGGWGDCQWSLAVLGCG